MTAPVALHCHWRYSCGRVFKFLGSPGWQRGAHGPLEATPSVICIHGLTAICKRTMSMYFICSLSMASCLSCLKHSHFNRQPTLNHNCRRVNLLIWWWSSKHPKQSLWHFSKFNNVTHEHILIKNWWMMLLLYDTTCFDVCWGSSKSSN